jgi:DNA repair exonuclease SbcCD ATPase subunit
MGRDDLETLETQGREGVILASGAFQAGELAHTASPKPRDPSHIDDRMSVFWRVFGGTILSILALIAVTLYNNLTSQINELRSELNRVNEARAELVKKEEFNTRNQNMWDRLQSLQDLRVTVTALKEQLTSQNEKSIDVKAVTDKLGALELRLKQAEDDHKATMKAEVSIAGLEQKGTARDAQLKAMEDDRKDLVRQLQELRERLAKVEGATEVKPMPKMATPKDK